jgi:hypothetical protein
MSLRSAIEDLRGLITEADEFEDEDTEQLDEDVEAGPVDEVTKHYPMAHKNSLGPGPKGRKFGGGDTEFMWHCKCPGGKCTCNRKSALTGKMLRKSWTVDKERKARYDKMYKAWRAKKERKGK